MPTLEQLPASSRPDCVIDHAGVLQVLPHRFPFLFVDAVESIELGKTIRCFKNVSFGEPFFQGHFPTDPVMPGVLQVEALAQAATILILLSFPAMEGKRPAFMGIDQARFRRPVRPGDVLTLEVTLESFRRGVGKAKCVAKVGDAVSCDAEILATMV